MTLADWGPGGGSRKPMLSIITSSDLQASMVLGAAHTSLMATTCSRSSTRQEVALVGWRQQPCCTASAAATTADGKQSRGAAAAAAAAMSHLLGVAAGVKAPMAAAAAPLDSHCCRPAQHAAQHHMNWVWAVY